MKFVGFRIFHENKLNYFECWKQVGVNCLKFDCLTIICSTLLAANQLLNTKLINCSNPVNPGSTGFEQLTLLSSVTYELKKSIFYL